MYKNKYFCIVYLICMFFFQKTHGQDAEFSQFLNNPVYLNPAMYGINGGPRFIANYRNQWPELQRAFETYSFSYDQHFDKISGGIGVQVLTDNQAAGIVKTNLFSGGYNHLFRVSDNTGIRVGMNAAFIQKRLDWTRLLFTDQFDQSTALPVNSVTTEQLPDFSSKSVVDIGAGFIAYSKSIYLGIAAKHINQPNESFYNSYKSTLPVRFLTNFGAQIRTKRGKATYISPNIMFLSQAKFKQINGQLLLNTSPVLLGMGYRHTFNNSDALIFIAGIQKGIFRTVYSYDNTYSNLRGNTGGAHELSLIINFNDGKKAAAKRTLKNSIDCPDLL